MDTATQPSSIGIDIGKDVFHVVGFDADDKIAFRRKDQTADADGHLPEASGGIVGMEAYLSAHFVSRTLRQLGHEPWIIRAI